MFINDKLLNEIKKYCELNDIKDHNKFINDLIVKGFNNVKYGNKPNIASKVDIVKPIEIKEVIEEPKIIEKSQKEININDTEDDYDIYD